MHLRTTQKYGTFCRQNSMLNLRLQPPERNPVVSMAKKLFGNNIEPSCSYCEFGRPAPDGVMIFCRKFGPVAPYYSCKKFEYDPLKRVPKRPPPLPEFDHEDFEI